MYRQKRNSMLIMNRGMTLKDNYHQVRAIVILKCFYNDLWLVTDMSDSNLNFGIFLRWIKNEM